MLARANILVVDDDPAVRLVVRATLERCGYRVAEVERGDAVLAALRREPPALVILDVVLPGANGFAIAEAMRADGFVQPVLFLTSLGEVTDRVRGFEAGGDDYLVKPFAVAELAVRVRALLQRCPPTAPRRLRLGDVVVDLAARTATRGGKPLALTRREFLLLDALSRGEGRPVSREELLRAGWGYEPGTLTRTLDTHLWRLRRKLGGGANSDRVIRNISGLGYTLVSQPTAPSAGPSRREASP